MRLGGACGGGEGRGEGVRAAGGTGDGGAGADRDVHGGVAGDRAPDNHKPKADVNSDGILQGTECSNPGRKPRGHAAEDGCGRGSEAACAAA